MEMTLAGEEREEKRFNKFRLLKLSLYCNRELWYNFSGFLYFFDKATGGIVVARGNNQKLKLLYLARIMQAETDDTHGLTMPQIIDKLAAYDIDAHRKTIYEDFKALDDFGIEIIKTTEGNKTYYHAGNRDFEIAELKFLIDVVQNSKFITEKKSKKLIEKLTALVSNYDAKLLKRQVYVADRVKSMNESILYTVDQIHEAMNQNYQITFHYFEWDMDGKAKLKHDGKLYEVSPWALIYDDSNYYLEAYDEKFEDLKTYRVDKMQDVSIADGKRRKGRDIFKKKDKSVYTKNRFGMYAGKEELVTLLCENNMANVIIDRFGRDIRMQRVDDEHFQVRVDVAVSGNFLGWIIGIGGVKIVGPESVVEQMDRLIDCYRK